MSRNKDTASTAHEKRIEMIMQTRGLNREMADLYLSHIDGSGPVEQFSQVSQGDAAYGSSGPAAAAKDTTVVVKNNAIARLAIEFANQDIARAAIASLGEAGFKPRLGRSYAGWTIDFDSNVKTALVSGYDSVVAYNDYELTYNKAKKNSELTFSDTKKAKAFFDIFHLNQKSTIFSLEGNKVAIKGREIEPNDGQSLNENIDFSSQLAGASTSKKAAAVVGVSASAGAGASPRVPPAAAPTPPVAVKAPQAAGLQSQQQVTIYRAKNGSLAISFANEQEAAGFFAKFSKTVPLEMGKKASNNVCFLPLSSEVGDTGLYIANPKTDELGINFSSKEARDDFSKSLGLADHCKTFPAKEQKLFLKIEKLNAKSPQEHNFTASMPQSFAPAKSRLCAVQ